MIHVPSSREYIVTNAPASSGGEGRPPDSTRHKVLLVPATEPPPHQGSGEIELDLGSISTIEALPSAKALCKAIGRQRFQTLIQAVTEHAVQLLEHGAEAPPRQLLALRSQTLAARTLQVLFASEISAELIPEGSIAAMAAIGIAEAGCQVGSELRRPSDEELRPAAHEPVDARAAGLRMRIGQMSGSGAPADKQERGVQPVVGGGDGVASNTTCPDQGTVVLTEAVKAALASYGISTAEAGTVLQRGHRGEPLEGLAVIAEGIVRSTEHVAVDVWAPAGASLGPGQEQVYGLVDKPTADVISEAGEGSATGQEGSSSTGAAAAASLIPRDGATGGFLLCQAAASLSSTAHGLPAASGVAVSPAAPGGFGAASPRASEFGVAGRGAFGGPPPFSFNTASPGASGVAPTNLPPHAEEVAAAGLLSEACIAEAGCAGRCAREFVIAVVRCHRKR